MMIHQGRCRGEERKTVIPEYTPNVGIDGVVVCNAVTRIECKNCNEAEIVIPNLGELHAAIALVRVGIPVKLNNKDIRFLRKVLGLQAKTLAHQLGVAAETLSRYESLESSRAIPPAEEKLLRLIAVQNLQAKARGIAVNEKQIATMEIPSVRNPEEPIKMRFFRVLLKETRQERAAEVWDTDTRLTGTNG